MEEFIQPIIIGIIIGIFIDHLLFRIWHFFAHSTKNNDDEREQKKTEREYMHEVLPIKFGEDEDISQYKKDIDKKMY